MARGPGMSSGCRTCRRRRVKCDERHPGCARCERADYDCEGYTRDHRFIDENAKTKRFAKKSKSKSKSPGTSGSASQSPAGMKDRSGSAIEGSSCAIVNLNLNLKPAFGLGLGAFEGDICTSFLLSHLLSGDTGFLPVPWMREHAEDTASVSAQTSIRALGALYFGKLHRLKDIADRSHNFYGKALVALNSDLQQAEKAWSLSVVKSAMILELYEFIDYKSPSSWLTHAGGVAKLIQLRGPHLHQTFMDRYMLEGNRVTIALECLISKKRCFLEHEDWKTIPYALDPGAKTSMNYLHDILCDVPGLVEDIAVLESISSSSLGVGSDADADGVCMRKVKQLQLSLSQKVLAELKMLYEWRASWARENQGSWWEVPSACPKTRDLFPTVIHFKSLLVANGATIYNAILLLLRSIGYQVIGPTFDPAGVYLDIPTGIDYGVLYAPREAPDGAAIAREICRMVEYHLGEERKSAGGFFLLFPLSVAWRVFEEGRREAEWVRGVMDRVADSSGFGIGRRVWADGGNDWFLRGALNC
ncbi:hypothetical protein IFR05_008179 [Cadophora sp. M221]|nr:hypothetical protein IFR05_008179 [Cadophora sp. M221]